jgi:hypothetical protein
MALPPLNIANHLTMEFKQGMQVNIIHLKNEGFLSVRLFWLIRIQLCYSILLFHLLEAFYFLPTNPNRFIQTGLNF